LCAQSSFEAAPAGGACTALAWAPSGAALPPTLAVSARGAPAGVWCFAAELRRWAQACALPQADDVSGLAWAPGAGASPLRCLLLQSML
jgi:hypothetical protein